MPGKRINPRLPKVHRAYAVDEAARLLGVHKNTIWTWVKSGLPTIDKSRPALMLGSDLREWLSQRRKAAKQPCPPGTIYCMKCRQPRAPALGLAEYTTCNAISGDLSALCEICETVMHRRTCLADLSKVLPGLDVLIREGPSSLREQPNPSPNCDKQKDD
ncbi:helix-turn-helix domain-containing protein [Parasphingopyxis marina]|uniref:Helix-turn-helix domain-containing protein n=1 Tax=Parasphingopyxis marina TaxID=2761622 RepID=A0A842HUQ6_9SPHN|nr:helix-turn-helix domain-containing protein [Parasphingopyxis marina]MBC2776732.1 helix-turn-helix domain-containing protein [Parasphingopyxis marina]